MEVRARVSVKYENAQGKVIERRGLVMRIESGSVA